MPLVPGGVVCSWSCDKCSGCFISVFLPSCACYLPWLLGPLAGQPWEQLWVQQGQPEPKPAVLGSSCVSVSQGSELDGPSTPLSVSHPLSLGLLPFWRPMLTRRIKSKNRELRVKIEVCGGCAVWVCKGSCTHARTVHTL